MNFVDSIKDFFSMILFYITYFIEYFKKDELHDLIQYLYNCIPVEIRSLFIIIPLFLLFTGFFKAFRH